MRSMVSSVQTSGVAAHGLSCPVACGVLVPGPRIEATVSGSEKSQGLLKISELTVPFLCSLKGSRALEIGTGPYPHCSCPRAFLKGFFREIQALRLSRVSKAQAGPRAAPSHPTWKPHLGLVAWVCETPCVRSSKSPCGHRSKRLRLSRVPGPAFLKAWSGQEKLSFSR